MNTKNSQLAVSEFIGPVISQSDYTFVCSVPKPIWQCNILGTGNIFILNIHEENHVPNWFHRQCQRFFLGTKWTKINKSKSY
jgi:hypothetical protein